MKNLTDLSLKNPAGVFVGCAIIVLFGIFSIVKLPVQLFPSIERPNININTNWRAASPKEIESEILEPQEEVLQGLPGLLELQATANPGGCNINLRFSLETDMQKTLIDVISRLNRLPPLPRDATPPQINSGFGGGGGGNEVLSWFFVQLLPGSDGSIENYQRTIEDVVKPAIEAVPGVAGVQVNAWAQEELQIVFDPYKAAELGIDIPMVANAAGAASDVSGGFIEVGRRQYTLRFAGRYSPQQMSELVLDWRDGKPIKLGDVAEIGVHRGDKRGFTIQNGNPAMSIRVDKENGANALQTLTEVKAVVAELRDNVLEDYGLTIAQSFDATVFIKRAITLVSNNLVIGIILAVGVLWLFLRRLRATLIVGLAIPASLMATFVVLNLTGRSLNVISLAGLAFAVGMVLDAAIVVMENIVRLREKGLQPFEAASKGTAQVWGALLASTATTVAIFLPVIFLRDVEGQLFADLALTIAIAVLISLFVAVIILPTLSLKGLQNTVLVDKHAKLWDRLTSAIMGLTNTPTRRFGLILVLMAVPITATIMLIPKLDYLPPVKRDAIDAFFSFPPGANTETIEKEIVAKMVERIQPYMRGEKEPALKNYYFIIWPNGGTLGIRAKDQSKVEELGRLVREEFTSGFPDTMTFASQGNLFGGFGDSRSIDIHLQSRDTQALLDVAKDAMDWVPEVIPNARVRPFPGTELAEPELRLIPNDRALNEAGWSRSTVATVTRALGDGLYIGEYFNGEKRMNIILKSEKWQNPESLSSVPLVTGFGAVKQLGELVEIERTVGPSRLRRIDRRRTLTLSVTPPDNMALEEALETLKAELEPRLAAALPADGSIRYGGGADSLAEAVRNMSENFLLALVVLFMLMAALFRSAKDSLLVVLALPLATVGGVIAIRLLNLFTFQPLDLLTMIGFIILLGLVVNNAILLVHQARESEREGLDRKTAVAEALRLRLRPIFSSTLTSIFGMLPLLLMPGTGSVIYRGLAAVIVGGMCVSTIFTLVLLPCFLRVGESAKAQSGQSPAPGTQDSELRQAA